MAEPPLFKGAVNTKSIEESVLVEFLYSIKGTEGAFVAIS
jgi:hypothetical protein